MELIGDSQSVLEYNLLLSEGSAILLFYLWQPTFLPLCFKRFTSFVALFSHAVFGHSTTVFTTVYGTPPMCLKIGKS